MSDKKWFVPGLIIIGLVLIIVSIWGPTRQFRPTGADSDLAFVQEKSGVVTVRNNEMPGPVQVKKNSSIKARDILRTDENSDVVIQWSNEGQFRVTEKSEVLIDLLENGQPLVVIRSGDLYIEKFGHAPSFWVRKDGQLLSAIDFALADKKNINKLKDKVPDQKENSQLSQFEIESLLNSKKADFFKCYGQVLQKNPQARGQVLISFTIQNQGQTSKIEISKSDITDNSFKSCIMEIVARTQFKGFNGLPITTVFPLKFE